MKQEGTHEQKYTSCYLSLKLKVVAVQINFNDYLGLVKKVVYLL